MTFDEADLDQLAADGELEPVITHVMGHVLGIGTFWGSGQHDLRAGTSTSDPYCTGAAGRLGFASVGGDSYDGTPVPVANTGGSGTEGSHWRESVFDDEPAVRGHRPFPGRPVLRNRSGCRRQLSAPQRLCTPDERERRRLARARR